MVGTFVQVGTHTYILYSVRILHNMYIHNTYVHMYNDEQPLCHCDCE